MKIIHVSDTHLGCEIPVEYKEIRKKDFLFAFNQVVDFAIKEKVDAIIHSGDFFDTYFRITSGVLEDVIDSLIKLKNNEIPIIFIKGNHDVRGHRQKVINILKKLGLVLEANPKEPIKIKDIYIYGISEPENLSGNELREYYNKVLPNIKVEKDGYSIFLFHGSIDILNDEFYDPRIISVSSLPKNIDYYALGHFHIPKKYIENEKVFALPGSTERTEISYREQNTKKGFYLIKDDNIEFIEIKTRNIYILERFVEKEEDVYKIVDEVLRKSKESIIKLRIKYKKDYYDILKNKIDLLIKSDYYIIDDLYPEDEEIHLEEETEEMILEDILNKSFLQNKKEIIDLFNKIKSIMEDYYIGKDTDIDKIRRTILKELLQ